MPPDRFQAALRQQYAMMQAGELCDFIIIVEGKPFPVHKVVLSGRSPYFKALFAADMLESSENRLYLVDVEVEVFEKFLKFIYILELDELDIGIAVKLMMCGEKYGMYDLVECCERYLLTNINAESAARCLLLAELLGRRQLKKYVAAFIRQHWEEVFESEGWPAVVTNHSLVTELLDLECASTTECSTAGKLELGCSSPLTRTWCVSTCDVTLAENHCVESLKFSIHKDCADLAWKFGVFYDNHNNTFVISFIHVGLPEVFPITCSFAVSRTNSAQLCSGTITTSCCFEKEFTCRKVLVTLPAGLPFSGHDEIFVHLTCSKTEVPTPSINYFNEYLEKSSYTDAVVELQKERFSVHKVILSSASPVFAEKFMTSSLVYRLNDVEPTTFRKVLFLIYGRDGDEIPDPPDFDLLRAVKLYELNIKLINRCRAALLRDTTYENIMDFLVEAHKHGDMVLKDMVYKFLMNRMHSLGKPANWEVLKGYAEIQDELLRFVVRQSKQHSFKRL